MGLDSTLRQAGSFERITFGCFTWEMDPPWMNEGLSVGLVVGMSGGGEGMLAGRLGRLNVTRTPSGIPWTSWLETGWRTTINNIIYDEYILGVQINDLSWCRNNEISYSAIPTFLNTSVALAHGLYIIKSYRQNLINTHILSEAKIMLSIYKSGMKQK